MPSFKEKNGISRLQDLIDKAKNLGSYLPEEVLQLAGVISPRIGQLIKAFNLISDDEKVDPMLKEQMLEALEFAIQEMENVTERHRNDNFSEHKITALTRPIISFTVLFYVLLIAILDRFGIGVKDDLLDMQLVKILGDITMFFFGGRTLEKIVKTFSDAPEEQKSRFKLFNRKEK